MGSDAARKGAGVQAWRSLSAILTFSTGGLLGFFVSTLSQLNPETATPFLVHPAAPKNFYAAADVASRSASSEPSLSAAAAIAQVPVATVTVADAAAVAKPCPAPTPCPSSVPALAAVAGVATGASASCDVEKIRVATDERHEPAAKKLRGWLGNRAKPTFEELYQLVVDRPFNASNNIYTSLPNPYNMTSNFKFPFSNLRKVHIDKVFALLGRENRFAVEVGSFHGHSAVWQALVLDQHGFKETPLLCIDPWTGALGMLLNRDLWGKDLTPNELAGGRSTSYWQFMLNVRYQIQEKNIGPKHIVPLAVTSIVGARYLAALGLTPDTIFLDSAHEVDETFVELTLFWEILAEGGVLFGDDLSWESVKHDVSRFVKLHSLELITDDENVIWMIKKPQKK